MKHRLIAASLALTASLLASSPSIAGGSSGTLSFSGAIVEPPCPFELDSANHGSASLHPACPRPAAGSVEFVNADTRQAIKTVHFTQLSRSIELPAQSRNNAAPIIAVITYE
jgi:type 1 fimbria pilin